MLLNRPRQSIPRPMLQRERRHLWSKQALTLAALALATFDPSFWLRVAGTMFAEARIEKPVKGVEEEIRVLLPRLKLLLSVVSRERSGETLDVLSVASWQEEPAVDLEKEERERREREMAAGI